MFSYVIMNSYYELSVFVLWFIWVVFHVVELNYSLYYMAQLVMRLHYSHVQVACIIHTEATGYQVTHSLTHFTAIMSSERRVGSNRSSERELSEPLLIEISFPETENPDSPGKRSLEPEFWFKP